MRRKKKVRKKDEEEEDKEEEEEGYHNLDSENQVRTLADGRIAM